MTRRGWIIAWAGLLPVASRAKEKTPAITLENYEASRLGAAIFTETNRVRAAEGRARLRALAALERAAVDQATTMAARLRATHDGPFAGGENAMERMKRQGLEPEIATENVSALNFPLLSSGETWADAYDTLAAEIVREWLASPGHRRNLLRREVTHLGCAARLARVPIGPLRIFSVQVFYRPKDERWKPFVSS